MKVLRTVFFFSFFFSSSSFHHALLLSNGRYALEFPSADGNVSVQPTHTHVHTYSPPPLSLGDPVINWPLFLVYFQSAQRCLSSSFGGTIVTSHHISHFSSDVTVTEKLPPTSPVEVGGELQRVPTCQFNVHRPPISSDVVVGAARNPVSATCGEPLEVPRLATSRPALGICLFVCLHVIRFFFFHRRFSPTSPDLVAVQGGGSNFSKMRNPSCKRG